jgi:hypothetical protein
MYVLLGLNRVHILFSERNGVFCSGAFGLSYQGHKNHTVVTLGEDIVYSTGKYMVLYRKDQKCAPRMRISKPDITVVGVTSMTTAPDHSRVAAIEQLENSQRITFWDSNMGTAQPPIACSVQVGHTEPILQCV